jgi:hypothetical protein
MGSIMIKVNTWADNFGKWHATVRTSNYVILSKGDASSMAGVAIRAELNARRPDGSKPVSIRIKANGYDIMETAIGLDIQETFHYVEA